MREKAAEAYTKGKFLKAAELYTLHCAKEPKDHQSRVRLGDAWARAQRPPQAIVAYREAAEGFAREGFLPRAIGAAKLILELDPKHGDVQQLLADLYARRRGPGRESVPAKPSPPLQRAIALEPLPAQPPAMSDDVAFDLVPETPPAAPQKAPDAGPDPFALMDTAASFSASAHAPDLAEEPIMLEKRSAPKWDELELDVEAAAQALWAGPGASAAMPASDSLLHAVEAAAEAAGALGEAAEPELPQESTPGGLPHIPLFSDLDPDAFLALFHRCALRRFAAGETIIAQGEPGDAFYVVCAGKVRVLREEGGKPRMLAELGEGAFFGEMALLSGAPRAASVEGASEEAQVLEISGAVLSELATSYPGVVRALRRFCRQRMLANVLDSAPLFTAFERRDRKAIAERFLAREAAAQEVLVEEGKESDGLYVVLAGEVEVRRGGKPVAILREGELFGEMSVLTKAPAEVSVRARRRTSLLRLPRAEFDALISSHPQVLVLVSELVEARSKRA